MVFYLRIPPIEIMPSSILSSRGIYFGMDIGDVGVNHPIPSNVDHCLYLYMRVNSSLPDSWYAVWLATETETVGNDNGGQQ